MNHSPCYENPEGLTFAEDSKLVWTVTKRLGKGGFSIVYEAKSNEEPIQRTVALKITDKKVEYAKNEAILLKKLSHPNIVSIVSCFKLSHKKFATCLELCGENLLSVIERKKTLDEPTTRCYVEQLLNCLDYLHNKHQIVHRDLKCGNILFDLNDEKKIKLCDFGLARQLTYNGELLNDICGTPNYVAPEVINQVGYSFEVDIWSLGVIAYVCLFGRGPFETSEVKSTYKRIDGIIYYFPDRIQVSEACKNFIKSVLVKQEKRPKIEQLRQMKFINGDGDNLLDECQIVPTTKVEVPVDQVVSTPLISEGKKFKQFLEELLKLTTPTILEIDQSLSSFGEKVEPQDTFLKDEQWITSIWVDERFGTCFKLNNNIEGAFFNDLSVALWSDQTFTKMKVGNSKDGRLRLIGANERETDAKIIKYDKVVRFAHSLLQMSNYKHHVGPPISEEFLKNFSDLEIFPFLSRAYVVSPYISAFRTRTKMLQFMFQDVTFFLHLHHFDYFYVWYENQLKKVQFSDLGKCHFLKRRLKHIPQFFRK